MPLKKPPSFQTWFKQHIGKPTSTEKITDAHNRKLFERLSQGMSRREQYRLAWDLLPKIYAKTKGHRAMQLEL